MSLTVKRKSQKQEKSVAKSFGARPTAASGALWGMKGDVRSDKFLIECKTTEKSFYPVTTKVWEKIEDEAIKDHDRTPLLVVDLIDRDRYVIFNPKYFEKSIDPLVVKNTSGSEWCSSFRVYSWGKEVLQVPLLFSIKSNKVNKDRHNLALWTVEKFQEYFKEEL